MPIRGKTALPSQGVGSETVDGSNGRLGFLGFTVSRAEVTDCKAPRGINYMTMHIRCGSGDAGERLWGEPEKSIR